MGNEGVRRTFGGLAALGALLFAGAALADPAGDQPPDWLHAPTSGDIRAAFPNNGAAQQRGGSATVSCIVTTTGAVRDCRVAAESPAGLGFGQAALTLTPQFLFRPASHNGQPVEAGVNIPIRFDSIEPGLTNSVVFSAVPWTRAPTAEDLLRAYPAGPRRDNQSGHVVLRCFFTPDRAQSCRSTQEEPRRRGFAEAAVRLSDRFRGVRPRIPSGIPEENTQVVIPFTFDASSLHSETPVLGTPEVADGPDAAMIRAAYPAAALSAAVEGSATLTCRVAGGGAVEACQVASETPAGQGFGAAALSLAPRFHATLWSADGLPTLGAAIEIRLTFSPPTGR